MRVVLAGQLLGGQRQIVLLLEMWPSSWLDTGQQQQSCRSGWASSPLNNGAPSRNPVKSKCEPQTEEALSKFQNGKTHQLCILIYRKVFFSKFKSIVSLNVSRSVLNIYASPKYQDQSKKSGPVPKMMCKSKKSETNTQNPVLEISTGVSIKGCLSPLQKMCPLKTACLNLLQNLWLLTHETEIS